MDVSPAVRESAARAAERLQNWADAFALTAAISASEATHSPGAAAWTTLSSILNVVCGRAARAKTALANDPPSEHFRSQTRPFRHPLNVEALLSDLPDEAALVRDGLLELGPLRESSLELALSLREDAADLGAMVRAFERATGAVVYEAGEYVEPRLAELDQFAERASVVLVAEANQALELASAIEATPELREFRADFERPGSTLDELLPAQSLAALFKTGIRFSELRVPVPPRETSDAVANLPLTLRQGAPDISELGRAVREWQPRSDIARIRGRRT